MSRRSVALGVLLAGIAVAISSGYLPWALIIEPQARAEIAGQETTGGLAPALTLAAAAGSLLIMVLGARGRRVVGVVVGLVGAGMVLTGLLFNEPPPGRVDQLSGSTSFDIAPAIAVGVGAWLYVCAGVLLVAGAVLTIVHSPGWPSRVRRFERPDSSPPSVDTDDPLALWQAMDAGLDPTAGIDDRPGQPVDPDSPDDPDVRKAPVRDTMS